MRDSVTPDQQSVVKERVASILWLNQGFDLVHNLVVNFLQLFSSVILVTFQCISWLCCSHEALKANIRHHRERLVVSDYHLYD